MRQIVIKYALLNFLVSFSLIIVEYYALKNQFHWNLLLNDVLMFVFCILSTIGISYEIKKYLRVDVSLKGRLIANIGSTILAGVVIGIMVCFYALFINTEYSNDMVNLTLYQNPEYLMANGADSEGMYLGAIIGYSWLGMLITYPIVYAFNGTISSLFILIVAKIKRYRLTSRST